MPNGIATSPDDKILYLIDADGRVLEAVPVSRPWKLVSREVKPDATVVSIPMVGPAKGEMAQIGGGHFGIIAGPCAVEHREQLFQAADGVRAAGVPARVAAEDRPRSGGRADDDSGYRDGSCGGRPRGSRARTTVGR